MKQRSKYVLITAIISLLFFGSLIIAGILSSNWIRNNPQTPDWKNPYYDTIQFLTSFGLYVMAVIIIGLSIQYQYKNVDLKNYFKSFLIPITYGIVFLIAVLYGVFPWVIGTGGGILFFPIAIPQVDRVIVSYFYQFLITFILVAILNFIIYSTRKNK